MISPHGPIDSKELSDAQRIKRAASNKLGTNTANDAAGILYTSTKITITKVVAYATTVISAGTLTLDIGIDGNDDAVVEAAALSDKALDSVNVLTINGSADVAAGKMVTASVHAVSGDASETVMIAIEYYENE